MVWYVSPLCNQILTFHKFYDIIYIERERERVSYFACSQAYREERLIYEK